MPVLTDVPSVCKMDDDDDLGFTSAGVTLAGFGAGDEGRPASRIKVFGRSFIPFLKT
jgi:hypothetical protein